MSRTRHRRPLVSAAFLHLARAQDVQLRKAAIAATCCAPFGSHATPAFVNGLALPATLLDLSGGGTSVNPGDLGADTLAALGGAVPEKWEGLAIGPRLADGSFLVLAGTDNDYSVSQIAGSPVHHDVYFKPGTGNRLQCDIGTFSNCVVMKADGTLGAAVAAGFDTAGYTLIPGVLQAYRVNAADLAGYAAPVPKPQTTTLLLAGLGVIGWSVRRRRR